MNGFLKILEKHKIKKNICLNPPKQCILKPKPLLDKNNKKTIHRNFGKEIQNLRNLTEEHYLFNNKKRYRKKFNSISKCNKNDTYKNKLILSKIEKNIHKSKKKIFNVIHLSHNKITKNNNNISCIEEEEEEVPKENINTNKYNDLNISRTIINICINNENKKEINILEEKNNTINNNINGNNMNIKKIKVIKKNNNKNSHNVNEDDKNDNSKVEKESQNELKKIKVCIIGSKILSPKKQENNIKKRLDLQSAKEYLDEIYSYLKELEKEDLPLENYISVKQTDINEKMRIILINWLIEVHFKFHLLSETLFICINIIDRYLSKKDINRKNLQLLGVTSLFIACKYEEIYAPSSKDLIFMTDNAYKIEEMIQMESDILNIIHFDLTYPTSLRFLEIYKHLLDLNDINFYRCCYLCEICLINYNLCSFKPSLIACVCLYLNLKSNILYFKGYNEEKLFNITGYQIIDIKNCLNKLITAMSKIEEPGNKFAAIKRKYALEKYMKVSNDSYLIKEIC